MGRWVGGGGGWGGGVRDEVQGVCSVRCGEVDREKSGPRIHTWRLASWSAPTLNRAVVRLGWVTRQGKSSGCFSSMKSTSGLRPSCSTNGCWLSATQKLVVREETGSVSVAGPAVRGVSSTHTTPFSSPVSCNLLHVALKMVFSFLHLAPLVSHTPHALTHKHTPPSIKLISKQKQTVTHS